MVTRDIADRHARRDKDHTRDVLEQLDGWIARTKEINACGAARGTRSLRPTDASRSIAATEQRLTALRELMQS
jgi:hypothetical protein